MSDLPRLLLCCFDVVPGPTAISRRLTEYVRGLSDRYQLVMLTVKTPEHSHIEKYHQARLLRVPVGSGDLASRVQAFERAVRRQLESEEYALVHCFDPFGGYALCERRSELAHKIVYDAGALPSVELPFSSEDGEANRRFLARVRRQELFCLMNADMVIVANALTSSFVIELGVAPEQVRVLHAPVESPPEEPPTEETAPPAENNPIRLIHLGNLSLANELSTVIESLAMASQQGVKVQLSVVGPSHAGRRTQLEKQIESLGLKEQVQFQPPVTHEELPATLAGADVGLLTLSDVERNNRVGSPLSRLSEYLSAGRPIIAADVASARAVTPPEAAIFYQPGSAASLASAMVTLAKEPALRLRMGEAARLASNDRASTKIRADLVAIYVGLIGSGSQEVVSAEDSSPDEVTPLRAPTENEDTDRKRVAVTAESSGSRTAMESTLFEETARSSISVPSDSAPALPIVLTTEFVPEPVATVPQALPAPAVTAPNGPELPEKLTLGLTITPQPVAPNDEVIDEVEFEAVNEEEQEAIADDEVFELIGSPSPSLTDDNQSMAADDSVVAVDTDPLPPASALEPWLAQLVHGYCPPESGLFERHTPPTTMPGRDN